MYQPSNSQSLQQLASQGIPAQGEMPLTALDGLFSHYLFSHILELKVSVKRKCIFYKDKNLQCILSKLLFAFVTNQIRSHPCVSLGAAVKFLASFQLDYRVSGTRVFSLFEAWES